eukprot:TRINITY_DN10007_c0_g1_i1.p1 TRINITY_DN10007_c0_g1~~TRINITY_DN10007_c0_g1_i1.p1  ORF type:complete len:225 (-),score=22.73 TRINITY_DN10007_c0_g1_i1:147-785(-)
MPRYVLSWLCDDEMKMSFERFKELIDSGKADPYTRAPHGGTCVHTLAMGAGRNKQDCHKALMYLLDHYPTLVNDRSQLSTETPLHLSAMYALKETFRGLLERGADPTVQVHMGEDILGSIADSFLPEESKKEMTELAEEAITNWRTKCHLPGCGATRSTDGRPLHKCGNCRRVLYCSREHQAEHWRTFHKKLCKSYQELNNPDSIQQGCPSQ